MNMRPVLGIVCCTREHETEPAQAVINRYIEAAVTYADAVALLIPALPGLISADDVASRIDGLLLSGSPSNVAPGRYGDGNADGDGPFDPARDEMALAMVAAMIARGKPVFGICRGFQEINVALGGTLRRDTSAAGASLPHHAAAGAPFDTTFTHRHAVTHVGGGLLQRSCGRRTIEVNSVHYQGIGQLAPTLAIEAHAPDGLVEAYSARIGEALVLAVQWHPEWDAETNGDSQIFFHLLGKALRRAPLLPDEGARPAAAIASPT